MNLQIILIAISAALLASTIALAILWRSAKKKNLEYEEMSKEYEAIRQAVDDQKDEPGEPLPDAVARIVGICQAYMPIMDDLIAARREIKDATDPQQAFPACAIELAKCVGRNKVLWSKSIRDNEEASADFALRLDKMAKDIKDAYKPAEAEAVGLLVKDHIRPMLDSLPNYRSFGENERNEILAEMLSLAFATIDAMLYTRQSDPANNDNLLQMKMLRGEISDQAAMEAARKVTSLESETPLWAIRLNTLLQDLADKYSLPKRSLLLRGYRFDIGA